nr:MAG TPA: hypothetical protein [Caudoviricetes sp.]
MSCICPLFHKFMVCIIVYMDKNKTLDVLKHLRPV